MAVVIGFTIGLLHWWLFWRSATSITGQETVSTRWRLLRMAGGYGRLLLSGAILRAFWLKGMDPTQLVVGLLLSVFATRAALYFKYGTIKG